MPLAFLIALGIIVAGIANRVVAFLLALAGLALAGPLSAYSAIARALARAEHDKRLTIGRRQGVEAAVRVVARGSAGIFAPRLVVVKVPSAAWRNTVRAFANVSAAALIDISEPTESLLWEIDNLETIAAKIVLVGDYERVIPLTTIAGEASGSITERLAALVDGREVLAYRREKRAMQRFARELSDALETAAG